MLRKVLAVAVASAIGVLNINAVIADQSPVKSVVFIVASHMASIPVKTAARMRSGLR